MSNYVLSFRAQEGRTATADEVAAWGEWFQRLGDKVVDPGHRVGQSRTLPSNEGDAGANRGVLGGYLVITANDLDGAVEMAKGCPGLSHGGGVEVGELYADVEGRAAGRSGLGAGG